MNEYQSYFRYWGKAGSDCASKLNYHLLVYHCLDVAAVGHALLSTRTLLRQLSVITSISEDKLLPWLTFILSIHDVGKFADDFQSQQADISQLLQGRRTSARANVHHTILGFRICKEKLPKLLSPTSKQSNDFNNDNLHDLLMPWINAVTGHHGRPPQPDIFPPPLRNHFSGQVSRDLLSFITDMAKLLLPDGIPFTVENYAENDRLFQRSSWLVAGLAVMADWLGSNRDWFAYNSDVEPLTDYWQKAIKRANVAIKSSGLQEVKPSICRGYSLFKNIKIPSPLQSFAEQVPISQGQQLFIIEEVTGGGKTEAAILLAHRLMNESLASGIYFGLPTMATANAMYYRIKNIYKKLYNEKNISLILAHSKAKMVLDMESKSKADNGYPKDGNSASQDCSVWLSAGRKKALLADIGIGTIDQALLSILPARHQSLRLIGLASKVLIVDEVHACDPYVSKLLGRLLKFHAAFGGSAILLSATLPHSMREQLLNDFSNGAKCCNFQPSEKKYPLLTHLDLNGLNEYPVDTRSETGRMVKVQSLSDLSEINGNIQQILDAGGSACRICNTVDDAVEAYSQWVELLGEKQVMLFHARFAMYDRLQIENEVIRTFGSESRSINRKGKLLIATQVVEQSLDIDFDYMVTDLAPIDLLIQRAGRLRRHSRDRSGDRIDGVDRRGEAILGILMPKATNDTDINWYKKMFPRAAAVYTHHGQLWLTAQWLQQYKQFSMPEDARNMIEHVYAEGIEIPAPLQKVEIRADGNDMADRSQGSFNCLDLEYGYQADVTHWQDDLNAPTRLGELVTVVRLARMVNDKFEPWIIDSDHDWELSELSVRQARINCEATGFKQERIALKKSMRDEGRYCVVVPLVFNEGCWFGKALNKAGEEIEIEYSDKIGLQFIKGEDK